MRKACRLAREVLDIAARETKPGVTTDYLDKLCHDACIERDVSFSIYAVNQRFSTNRHSPTHLL